MSIPPSYFSHLSDVHHPVWDTKLNYLNTITWETPFTFGNHNMYLTSWSTGMKSTLWWFCPQIAVTFSFLKGANLQILSLLLRDPSMLHGCPAKDIYHIFQNTTSCQSKPIRLQKHSSQQDNKNLVYIMVKITSQIKYPFRQNFENVLLFHFQMSSAPVWHDLLWKACGELQTHLLQIL